MKQRSRRLKRQILSSLSIFFLYMFQISGCSFNPNSDIILGLNNKNSFELIPVKFDELPGWNGDKHAEALKTFLISCLRIEKLDTSAYIGPYKEMGRVSQWIKICRSANKIRENNAVDSKYFFETQFKAFLVTNNKKEDGLFTGYYEPELRGSWSPTAKFKYPLFSVPKDLVSIDLKQFRPKYKKDVLLGRIKGKKLIPYYDRSDIQSGSLKGMGLEILWVDDPVDAFFLHIQGSGRILLPDGSHIRLGFAGRNGHSYTAIGRILVGMGAMKLDAVSMPSLKKWLKENPVAGRAVMNRNRSYIFFQVIQADDPIGAQNVPLTANRSLAVDTEFIPLGIPIWLDTQNPVERSRKLQRLVVSQDRGSAIKGPIRGDVFWGHGKYAEKAAGIMRERGRYFVLLPRYSM